MKNNVKKIIYLILLVVSMFLISIDVGATSGYIAASVGTDILNKSIEFRGGTYNITSEQFATLKTDACIDFEHHRGLILDSVTTTSFKLIGASQDEATDFNNIEINFSYSDTTLTVTPSSTTSFVYSETEDTVIQDYGSLDDFGIYILYVENNETSYPVMNGQTAIVTNVDNPISIESIKAGITCIDNEDGDITDSIIVVEDNYTANKNIVGTYIIKLSCSDSSNNTSTLEVNVKVCDVTAPVITGPDTYNAKISVLTPASTIQSLLSVSDNYSTGNKLNLSIKQNGYQANYNKVGTYTIIFEASDESGNKSTHTVSVIVKDDISPVFTGPVTILKNASDTLTINDIKSQLTANDNVDGNVTSRITIISDGYTGYGAKKGTYEIEFEVTDLSGNKATHIINITVSDNIPPVFYVDNYFIQVSQLITLSNDDIINLLIASGQIDNSSNRTVRFITNSYLGNENSVGIYPVSINVRSNTGEEDVINVAVQVTEDNTDNDIIEVPGTVDNWFTKDGWFGLKNFYWIIIAGVIIVILLLNNRKRR